MYYSMMYNSNSTTDSAQFEKFDNMFSMKSQTVDSKEISVS